MKHINHAKWGMTVPLAGAGFFAVLFSLFMLSPRHAPAQAAPTRVTAYAGQPEELRAELAGRALQGLLADFESMQMTEEWFRHLSTIKGMDDLERSAAVKAWIADQAVEYADAVLTALEQ